MIKKIVGTIITWAVVVMFMILSGGLQGCKDEADGPIEEKGGFVYQQTEQEDIYYG